MQFTRFAVMAGGLALVVTQGWASAPSLIPMDEPATTLSSPALAIPAIPAFQYTFGSNPLASLVTATPLLCANTAAATGSSPTGILPVYYSANGSVGTSPSPFVFGAASGSPATSAVAYGATNLIYNGSQVQFGGDPLDALVCYGLDANGVRRVTRDLFADGFEVPGTDGLLGNSTVALSVLRVPGVNGYMGNEYDYYIDAFVPDMTGCGALDCNFVLVEGYDTSLFTTGGQWCKDDGSNATNPGGCIGAWTAGDINIATSTGTLKLVAGHNYFAVRRYTLSSNSLPSAPAVIAALFSPLDLQENKLDDNVATGNNTLADLAPEVVTDSTYTAFTASLDMLAENTDSGSLLFDISDADTPEPLGGPYLSATVTLNLPGGLQVPVTANCTPNSGPGVANRQCAIDIPLNISTFWDGFVPAPYQGQFDDFATDTTNGTYANGVSASAQIVVTDSLGKASAPISLPVHVNSSKNDASVVTFDSNQLPSVQDSNDSNYYPTW
ncbi:MAG: hypothetical protein ACREPN_10185, partial [Rudaea sp.]